MSSGIPIGCRKVPIKCKSVAVCIGKKGQNSTEQVSLNLINVLIGVDGHALTVRIVREPNGFTRDV